MRFSLRDARFRAIVFQVAALLAVVLGIGYLVSNTLTNLETRKIASGFGFLSREAGFEIGETTLLAFGAADHYGRAFLVGLANTFRVAIIGVVLATILGTLLGLARLSSNFLLSRVAAGYVEIVRNVPLLVQLVLWYALISENMPGPRQALNPIDGVFISNRGIQVPALVAEAAHWWMLGAFLVGLVIAWRVAVWARVRQEKTGQQFHSFWVGLGIVLGLPLIIFVGAGAPLELNVPKLAGFNFQGGMTLTPEFAALLTGLVLYTAGFIAEIVRAGILAVHDGQTEAALALGLHKNRVMRLVVLPQALRVIIPPLTSQYLNLTKNSSLAVAIGYPDMVSIANTAINQTGQAIEGIGIIMAVYLSISLSISAFMNWYNKRIALVER
ncbi:MAG: amino acid ABC transporter permease [Proteobacteria bacterium]|nr:amino acid ABC transporter permease [Pseudomonadota bacterium]